MIGIGLAMALTLGVLGPGVAVDVDSDNLWSEVNQKYQQVFLSQTSAPAEQHKAEGSSRDKQKAPFAGTDFSCPSPKTCSEIMSCEEAYFYRNACGEKRLDKDKDDIPCEVICTGSSVASQAEHVPLHTKLNGIWQNDLMTVTIDFEEGVYSGVALGKKFFRPLVLVREYANIVIFKTINPDKTFNTITCQIQNDGSILLTKEGGIPLIFKRVMAE